MQNKRTNQTNEEEKQTNNNIKKKKNSSDIHLTKAMEGHDYIYYQ